MSSTGTATTTDRPRLLRAVGLFSLTAMAVNGMVGSGIFVLPAQVAGILGPASLLAYVIAGLATGLIVLCFAEVGSLFDRSGGPYLYAREAFGEWVGFEIGWMLLLARVTAIGAISNAFASYAGFSEGGGRIFVIALSVGALAAVNYYGVCYGAWANNFFAVAKLAPLIVFIAAGLFWIDPHRFEGWTVLQPSGLRQASLLLIFAFGGFEFAVVPGEEAINPQRNLPIALLSAMGLVTVLYMLIQVVAQGTLPGLASSPTPLADAAHQFLGPVGGLLLTAGALLSTTGTNSGTILTAPRIVYAMAEGGQLPSIFAKVHPRFRTPHVAIVGVVILGGICALWSRFALLAAVSAIARLLCYMSTCLALPVLRRKMPNARRTFSIAGGPVIPVLALAISGWLLAGSTRIQIVISAVSALGGAVLFGCYRLVGGKAQIER